MTKLENSYYNHLKTREHILKENPDMEPFTWALKFMQDYERKHKIENNRNR